MTPIARGLCLVFWWLAGCDLFLAAAEPSTNVPRRLFEQWLEPGSVTELNLVLSPPAVDKLRSHPRESQPAQVWKAGVCLGEVRLHLKGRGSFQPIEAKPNLTLATQDTDSSPSGGGLCWKLHLQNSAEDASYLNEWLGSFLARASRLPTPRIAHARVRLNQRDLGLYVVREGFTSSLLSRSRSGVVAEGTLWEPVDGSDVDGTFHSHSIEPGSGIKPVGHPRTLAKVAQEPDLNVRWKRFAEVLDVDAFSRLLALEVLLVHWDGYGLRHNNYRIWEEAASGRFQMLPSGMDQLLAHPEFPSIPGMNGLLARSFLQTAEGRDAYLRALEDLRVRAFDPTKLATALRQQAQKIEPGMDRSNREEFRAAVDVLCERIRERVVSLNGEKIRPQTLSLSRVTVGPGEAVAFNTDWHPGLGAEAVARLSRTTLSGVRVLEIRNQRPGSAAWETQVQLEPGRYEITARMRLQDFVPLSYGRNQGVRLRVAGQSVLAEPLVTTEGWQWVRCTIATEGPGVITLLWELRAERGKAVLDLDSVMVRGLAPAREQSAEPAGTRRK